ncbi:MAG: hypothetical protein R3D58_01015 [Saprospiraceae bacterium]
MQKLWLKNFEFHINPATWNTAQDLVQAGAVRKLQEVEKHFWVAKITDSEDQEFEVEVMITPHRIKAFTCECWPAGRRLMCAHIAAGLVKIRQFLEQKNEARQARSAHKSSAEDNRLSVSNVLKNATGADLAAFVREYARQDRDFSLALKTWFASQFTGAENPFSLVFDTALPRNAATRALKDAEIRRIRKTLLNLDAQLAAAQEESNVLAVYQITTALLQKIIPILPKPDSPKRRQILEFCQNAATHLIDLQPDNLSPELRESRRSFLLELLERNDYPAELEAPVTAFLYTDATETDWFERIRQLFDRTPFPAPQRILNLFLAALAQRNLPEAVVRVLQDYDQHPGLTKKALDCLYQLHCWEAVLAVGEHLLAHKTLNPLQIRELENMILKAAENAGNKSRYKSILRGMFQRNGSEAVYLRLKTLSGAGWPKERANLLGKFQSAGNIAVLAPLLAADGDLDTLTTVIKQQNNLALLQQYEAALLPAHQTFVRNFYISTLSAYLTEHFGRQAAEQVRRHLAGLLRLNQVALVKEIIVALIGRFPDRQSLPEELAELFLKSSERFAVPPAS